MADYPDFEGQKSGLYDIPHWAAKEATDKNFLLTANSKSGHQAGEITYVVPAGKTLYICGISSAIGADTASDYDHHLVIALSIKSGTTVLGVQGGNGGCGIGFSKPYAISAGSTFTLRAYNYSDITVNMTATAWGYEI